MKHRFTDLTPTSLRTDRSLRLYISSWEIGCCAPRPVIGEQLGKCVPVFLSAGQDVGWHELNEEIDTRKLSPRLSNTLGLMPGVHRGRLYGDFHHQDTAAEDRGVEPLSPGVVLRTRIISFDRVLNQHRTWVPVPGSMQLRDVTGAGWRFARGWPPNEAQIGDFYSHHDDGVLVDFLPLG